MRSRITLALIDIVPREWPSPSRAPPLGLLRVEEIGSREDGYAIEASMGHERAVLMRRFHREGHRDAVGTRS